MISSWPPVQKTSPGNNAYKSQVAQTVRFEKALNVTLEGSRKF